MLCFNFDLKVFIEGLDLMSSGRLFQALIVEGKKELLYKLVLHKIVCKSFSFLKLYLDLLPTRSGIRDDK